MVYTDGRKNYISDEPEENWEEVECTVCNLNAQYVVHNQSLCRYHYWDSLWEQNKPKDTKVRDIKQKYRRKRMYNYNER